MQKQVIELMVAGDKENINVCIESWKNCTD